MLNLKKVTIQKLWINILEVYADLISKRPWKKKKKDEVDKTLKIPVLCNLASCLMKLKKYQRGVDMLDQALKIDGFNEKANLKKV